MKRTDATKKVESLLETFDTAMLVTHKPSGELHARPMYIADREAGGDVWFVTSGDTAKVEEIEHDAHVCVTMQQDDRFLTLAGTARTIRDRQKIDELWSETWKVYFPQGKSSPDLRLIKVVPTEAEFWDNAGKDKARFMYEAGKAYLKGESIDTEKLDHEKVRL